MAESAGYSVIDQIEQIREPDARYQIGSGKVEELTKIVKEKDAEKIIFDNRLKTIQFYNLVKATGVETIDRFQLILEIFTQRAKTTEAQLQIQLAKRQYELVHAKEKVRLSKMKEQPGFRGLGAYKVDVYYNTVKREAHSIRRKLKKSRGKRLLHRVRRAELGFSSISLAGYTNAGKSSLFNALTEEEVTVEPTLFTTISTTTRLVIFSNKKLLLTDTVGFIDRLPLMLIEAFHSTLEETIDSDLIILVVDGSEAINMLRNKLNVCLETIEQIGAASVPIITAFNKIDLLKEKEIQKKFETLKEKTPTVIPISALQQTNFGLLKQEIIKKLKNFVCASLEIKLTSQTMSFISWLFKRTDVKKINYFNNFVYVVFESTPSFSEIVKNRVEEFDGKFEKVIKPIVGKNCA